MIVQSLGGMEVSVGVSLLTGGLVLDKKQTGPGKRLPIKYLFTSTPMPLTSNFYHVGQSIGTISRHDHRDHASSRINSCEPYSALRTLVVHSDTGGKGVFTQQAHGEFIVSSETIRPPITHQAHGGYFLKGFLNLPICYPPGTWWVLFKSAYDSTQWK